MGKCRTAAIAGVAGIAAGLAIYHAYQHCQTRLDSEDPLCTQLRVIRHRWKKICLRTEKEKKGNVGHQQHQLKRLQKGPKTKLIPSYEDLKVLDDSNAKRMASGQSQSQVTEKSKIQPEKPEVSADEIYQEHWSFGWSPRKPPANSHRLISLLHR